MDVYNDNLHNTLENIFETADIHSGIDLKFNELGDLVLRCYGNMYHYVPDNVTLETITDYHIVPVDNNNEKSIFMKKFLVMMNRNFNNHKKKMIMN